MFIWFHKKNHSGPIISAMAVCVTFGVVGRAH